MDLTAGGFAGMAARLRSLAGGRVVFALEGGYKPSLAAKGVLACVRVLLDDPSVGPAARLPQGEPRVDFGGIARAAHHALLETLRAHADLWPLLKGSPLANHPSLPLRLSERPSAAHSDGDGDGGGDADGPLRPGPAAATAVPSTQGAATSGGSSGGSSGSEGVQQCRSCSCRLPKGAFSASQLRRRRAGERVCKGCSGISMPKGAFHAANRGHNSIGIPAVRVSSTHDDVTDL
ncbi:hypothetical protein EMIHUDRAFT_362023 [Emiliania huxleyi CCMP1516]|uniref:Histone deacetylase n=2 Tax=Emiliania huxleyi TaxID=2903 RepID=A0A0D3KPI7_EMIH1|nr:hypothetical protein EMIHUDRAFT_362023 [Emiliania huxleyi CCMP1516]EOD37672.1 hypothetical protein EMIHUDRAFT_362023 [Emiliania huxleyi CCMP1516]|eukprot:XP_005790101.1 hypothetical protein EMIHUDRAFT_362023 [Emiliania huxleyi CCMP1516]